QAVIAEMQACEEALLHKDFRDCPAALEVLLADDFEEVSSRGQVTSRRSVVNWLLHKDPVARWQLNDLSVLLLTPELRLVRYKAKQILPQASAGLGALHSSLWCFSQ